jgi:hypothetical protein
MKWRIKMKTDYYNNINRIKKRYMMSKNLSKGQSNAILINECSWCEFHTACIDIIPLSKGYHLCIRRSTETLSTWIMNEGFESKKVEIGKKYGILEVIEAAGKNSHNQVMWKCKCKCGNEVVVAGYNLTSGGNQSCGCHQNKSFNKKKINKVYIDKKRKYTIGSSRNPDGTTHVLGSEHSSRVGCKTDHIVEIEDKNDDSRTIKTYKDNKCDKCKSLVRYNNHSEKQCENAYCALIY